MPLTASTMWSREPFDSMDVGASSTATYSLAYVFYDIIALIAFVFVVVDPQVRASPS